MARRVSREAIEVKIEAVGSGGSGRATSPEGKEIEVGKPAPPGSRLLVQPMSAKKGKIQARRLEMLEKPEGWTEPKCPIFGLCGGCSLQELDLEAQRKARFAYGVREVVAGMGGEPGALEGVTIHPCRGGGAAYRYRNKVEMSWGVRRYLSQEAHTAGEPIHGRWLGFHAGGWFDRIVDADGCWLISEAAEAIVAVIRRETLQEGQPLPWDVREHRGFWRHLLLRQGMATGELLVGLYTAPAKTPEEVEAVERLAEILRKTELPGGRLVGIVWLENAGVSDVAKGEIRKVWGEETLEERLGKARYRLSIRSFFQTSTEGAIHLYDTLAEAFGPPRRRLYDLYCGVGSIGIYLAEKVEEVIGVEEVPEAIQDAEKNARLNGIEKAKFVASRMEDALAILPKEGGDHALLVDPPRAGLHKRVAEALASAPGDLLLYVACNPASLGRDAAILQTGGWKLTELWGVDLFPQTAHIEMIGRFIRTA